MRQICGQTVKELFIVDDQEKAEALSIAEQSPKIELSLIDLQWLQVLKLIL